MRVRGKKGGVGGLRVNARLELARYEESKIHCKN